GRGRDPSRRCGDHTERHRWRGVHRRADPDRGVGEFAVSVGERNDRPDRDGIDGMTNAAPFRNPPPGPPHDPTWMLLRGRDGWPIATPSSGIAVSPLDCALVLQSLPGGPHALADPSGRFGGLVPPPNVALAPDGTVWLLNRANGKLRRFDECACAFVDVPCTAGIGHGARRLATPVA